MRTQTRFNYKHLLGPLPLEQQEPPSFSANLEHPYRNRKSPKALALDCRCHRRSVRRRHPYSFVAGSTGRDEGEFTYIGRLMLPGIPPYLMAYNMKLPGIYAAYALLMAVFGQTTGLPFWTDAGECDGRRASVSHSPAAF